MTTPITNLFADKINHVAKLDNSLAMSLTLNRSNIVLNSGSLYSYGCVFEMYNRTTNVTEHSSFSGADLTSLNFDDKLESIKLGIELLYPCAMSHSVVNTTSMVATFSNMAVSVTVSGNLYYIRDMVLVISDEGGVKYSIEDTLTNPIELTPKMLDLTPEIILAVDNVSNSLPAINAVLPHTAKIALVAGDLPNIDAVAANKTSIDTAVANMTAITNAVSSATSASDSASTESTSATNASTSATSAGISESSASGSATTATTKASEATLSALAASGSATAASGSATAASGSATTASAQASAASASSTASANSATASSASKDAAALSAANAANTLTAINTVFDNFDDRFLGAKASDPTLDNDGLTLLAGTMYFNIVSNNIKFYNGAAWENPQQTATQAATNASSSATAAGTSATNASNSATAASGSASEAATSATNASNSATSAANSLTSVQAIQTTLSNGRVWFFGVTQQSAETGIDGDAGFNTATGDVSRKIAGTWTVVGSLQGRGLSTILRTTGTGAAGTTDIYTITYSDTSTSTFNVYNGADGSGNMSTATYDTTGNGIVDNSEKVNGLTVLTEVPAGALFTDTVYAHPSTDGSLHVPATGTTNSGKVLTAGGTAGSLSWVTPASTGVTAVSGTAPVVSSGGNTPEISMAAASSGVHGYMTGTYATKLDGIATNANNYSLLTGSSTVIGGTKLFSDVVQSVAANAVSATASRSYGLQLNTSGQLVVNVPWTDVDTNTFPTTYTWTAGTVAGPTGSITGTSSTISVGAVPSASATESGIVTTGAQTFAGAKTFTSPVLVTPSIGVATGTSFNAITGLSSTSPAMNGVATVGVGTTAARNDHIHPTDTSRQDALVSGTNIKTVGGTSLLGAGDIAVVTAVSPALTGVPTINGISVIDFTKPFKGVPLFTKASVSTITIPIGTSVKVGANIITVSGTAYTLSLNSVAVGALDTGTKAAGTDYYVYALEAGGFRISANATNPTGYTTANSRKIGGFHYGVIPEAFTAINNIVAADVTKIAGINAYSFWDLNFLPANGDARGMFKANTGKWYDIYLLNTDHHLYGTSAAGKTIAGGTVLNGRNFPKIPLFYGGDGTTTYGTLTWFEASEIGKAYGKDLISYEEFAAIAYGVLEASSAGAADTGITQHLANYTSKFGMCMATGCQWIWSSELGRGTGATYAWKTDTEGRGSMYSDEAGPMAAVFGGNRDSTVGSGSRASGWDNPVWFSGWGIGSRYACNHLELA